MNSPSKCFLYFYVSAINVIKNLKIDDSSIELGSDLEGFEVIKNLKTDDSSIELGDTSMQLDLEFEGNE